VSILRFKIGTTGQRRNVSFITQPRYFSSFKSSYFISTREPITLSTSSLNLNK